MHMYKHILQKRKQYFMSRVSTQTTKSPKEAHNASSHVYPYSAHPTGSFCVTKETTKEKPSSRHRKFLSARQPCPSSQCWPACDSFQRRLSQHCQASRRHGRFCFQAHQEASAQMDARCSS